MELHVHHRVVEETVTLSDVRYFETRGDEVYIEFDDGHVETIPGDIYGGDAE